MAESMAMEEAGPGKISVCIITGNERRHIRRCLESVKWADEIVVVDSFSTDGTAQIVDEYTPRRYLHRWIGYIGQKSVAKSLARCEWILFVDADEAVSDQLHAEIADRFSRGIPDDVNGFDFPRQVWFLNRWIRHGDWYPDTKLRLFRRTRGACAGQEPHEKVVVAGRVEHLRSPLYHYTYDSIHDQINTLNRFSTISADGDHFNHTPARVLFGIFAHAPFRFFRCYVIKLGFLDGLPGLIVAVASSFGTFIKYAKLWEKQINARME